MWTITLDEDRAKRLRTHDWSMPDPFIKKRGEGDAYKLRMEKGRCVFLDENNLCKIHSKVGYDAKPEGCKAFPLHVAEVAGETRVRLSFYCPAVTANQGKRLQDQTRWIRQTVKSAGDVARHVPLTLDEELEITLRDLEKIEEALVTILKQSDQSIDDRLAAGAALLSRIQQATAKKGKAAITETLGKAELGSLAQEGRRGGSASRAGPSG